MGNSKFLRLNGKDFAKGISLAVLVAVIGLIQQSLATNGFDFALYNWAKILEVAVTAGSGYLVKNLISEDNKVLGAIG